MFQQLQEMFSKTSSDANIIKCLRCNKSFTTEMFKGIFNTCPQKRCWIRRPQAREQAARIDNCSPNDFIPIQSGSINVHPVVENNTSTWKRRGYYGD